MEILLFLLLLVPHLKQPAVLPAAPPPTAGTIRAFSPIDSLEHYAVSGDGFFTLGSNRELYLGRQHNLRIGFVRNDSILTVYHETAGRWQLTDSIPDAYVPTIDADFTDLNSDGFADLRIKSPVMRGNDLCTVLLYDPASHRFRHNPAFDLINIGYDAKTGFIRSSALGGNFDNSKSLYRLSGDTLMTLGSVYMEISANEDKGHISWSVCRKGIVVREKIYRGMRDQTLSRFDTSLGATYLYQQCR